VRLSERTEDQVGVKAPGRPTKMVFLPLVRSAKFTRSGGKPRSKSMDGTYSQVTKERKITKERATCMRDFSDINMKSESKHAPEDLSTRA